MKSHISSFIRIAAILVLVLLYACEPKEGVIVLSKRLKLITAEYDKENQQVLLEWNKPYLPGFNSYVVLRYETPPGELEYEMICYWDYLNNYICVEGYDLSGQIAAIYDPETNYYFDRDLIITDKLYYRIVAMGDSTLISNTITVDLMDVEKIDFNPADAVFDPDNNAIYFIGQKQTRDLIIRYDLDNRQVADSILFSTSIGSSDYMGMKAGSFSGNKELYAWVYNILYLIDPEEMTILQTGGNFNYIFDVCSDNRGHIFVSDYYTDQVASYNRSNLNIPLSDIDVWGAGLLFYYQEELLNIEAYSYPDYDYFAVNAEGMLTNHQTGFINLDEPFTGDFNREDGSLITRGGDLYTFDLNYLGTLGLSQNSNTYNRFCFDADSSQIYYNNYETQQIYVYSSVNNSFVRTFSTLGWPIRVFVDDDGTKIVVSRTSEYYSGSTASIIIERF